MGFLSVCCEYDWLIIKKTGLAWVEQSYVRKIKLNAGRKKKESERGHVAPLEPGGILSGKSQQRDNTQITRNVLN